MPNVQVRDVPEAVLDALKQRAFATKAGDAAAELARQRADRDT